MPRNGAGQYTAPNGTTAVPGTTISSAAYNGFVSDLSTEVTNSINVQGTAPMQATLNLGGFLADNLATPTSTNPNAAVTYAQLQAAVATITPVAPATTWTKLAITPTPVSMVGSATQSFINLPQTFGDLMIIGSNITINSGSIPLSMLVSTNNGVTYSASLGFEIAILQTSPGVDFALIFHGYSSDFGQASCSYQAFGNLLSPSIRTASSVAVGALSAHTGGCNAVRFQINAGVFNNSTASITIYGK